METLEHGVAALDFLVKTPSVELPAGPLKKWVEDMRDQPEQYRIDVLAEARTFPSRIIPYLKDSETNP
jgi:hypothetical protein